MNITMIIRQTPDSLNGIPRIVAVARTEKAAMQWIQDEVDGKHHNGQGYMHGKPAEYWVNEYPLFKLTPGELQEEQPTTAQTFEELLGSVTRILPEATIEEDNQGQLVIYTGLTSGIDGAVVPFAPQD